MIRKNFLLSLLGLACVLGFFGSAPRAQADIQRRAVLQWADDKKWSEPFARQITFFKGPELKKVNPKLTELPDDKVYAFADLGQQKVLIQLDASKVKSDGTIGFTIDDFRAIFEEKGYLMGPDVMSVDKRTWLITARKGKKWVDSYENRD
ncbi:MAG: hypothetical protein ACAI35_13830 [Candidatus Methylacidiphilales bacterium]|nr:hypothetical protein [Candidatus Methylacidiphilales bacterium]